jgi:hypothetical protein
MSDVIPGHRRSRGNKPVRWRALSLLALPTLLLLALVALSTCWRVPTRLQLDFATARLAFSLSGEEPSELLSRSAQFASLVVEQCKTAAFAAEKLEIADPRASQTESFPAAAWHEIPTKDLIRFSCNDPAAKLTLQKPGPAAASTSWLGNLDSIHIQPHSQVVLAVSPGREPALSLEIETPQDLTLALGPDLGLRTEFVRPEGFAVPFSGDLQTYRAHLPEGRRTIEITSSEKGMVLIMTPAGGESAKLFPEALPLASIELLEEDLRKGTLNSPLRARATLSYPDYPAIPPVPIEPENMIGLGQLKQARLTRLQFDTQQGALHARFDGMAKHATSLAGAFPSDHRLTLYHTFRYSWRWELLAMVFAWAASTTWIAFEAWRKLHEHRR